MAAVASGPVLHLRPTLLTHPFHHAHDPFGPPDPPSPFGHDPVTPNLPGSMLHPSSTQHAPLSGTWRHRGAGGHGALGWHGRESPQQPS